MSFEKSYLKDISRKIHDSLFPPLFYHLGIGFKAFSIQIYMNVKITQNIFFILYVLI